MKNLAIVLPILLLLVACTQGAGSNIVTTPISQSTGPFTLTISSPPDLDIVDQPQVDLTGQVNKTAVLTINDEIYLLKKGEFTEPLKLEEGINAIQIVASDMDGNEVDLILSITYQP